MHVGICAENIQHGLNKAPWPLACLQILITHPRRQSAPLTLFHESSVLMHSQEQALKPSKQALDLIFNKKNNMICQHGKYRWCSAQRKSHGQFFLLFSEAKGRVVGFMTANEQHYIQVHPSSSCSRCQSSVKP